MSAIFVRLRESGEVLEVEESLHSAMGVRPDAWIYFHTLDETCDLCDEHGRLLKPETMPRMTRLELVTDGPLWDSWVTACCRRGPITDEKHCPYCGAEIIHEKEEQK